MSSSLELQKKKTFLIGFPRRYSTHDLRHLIADAVLGFYPGHFSLKLAIYSHLCPILQILVYFIFGSLGLAT